MYRPDRQGIRSLATSDAGFGARPVTDQNASTEALSSEQHFRHIVDSIPGLIFTYDPHGCTEFVNRQLLEYFGCSFEELQRWEGADIVHSDDIERVTVAWRQNIAAGTAHSYEERLRRADGVYRWFQLRCAPAFDASGGIVRWYGCLTDIDELKRADDAAREDLRSLSLLIDSIPGLVFTTRANGEIEWINRTIMAYFGRTLEDLQSWRMIDAVHPEDLQITIDQWQAGTTSGKPYEFEQRLRRHDGVYRWFHYRASPLYDSQGKLVRWYGLVTDIDDLKRAQHEARRGEQQLRLMLDTIPGSVFTLTPKGEMEQVNRHTLDFFGKTFDELRDWRTVTHPDDVDAVTRWLEHALTTGEPWESTSRALRADGAYRWFQTRGLPLLDSDGHIVRWYCVNVDIDDLKLAQEDARRNERHLRLILDNIPGYAFTLTPAGEIEQLNQQILDYFGASFEELRDWARVTHPDDLERARRRLGHAIATGTLWQNEARALRADGVYRWFQTRGLPLRDSDGQILRWYCLLIDIEELKRAEEGARSIQARLARASQLAAVSELAASIAHEVNQPLAAVIANGHACHRWIAAEPPNVERALASVQRTIRDANSAAEIVSRIRALFRHAAPSKQLLNLNEVIEEVGRVIADDLLSRGVSLRLELQSDLPAAPADRVQVQQVVANLARNGMDAMDTIDDRAKELTITTSFAAGDIIVAICDAGIGVEVDESVFEPFVTTKPSGMGMGLAICKSILDAHDGRLWVTRNSNHGVTFSFALPAAK